MGRIMRTKSLYWFILAVVAILILGFVLTAWTVDQQDRSMREHMLIETRLGAAGINPAQVQALSGSPADLDSPDYQEIKNLLVNLRADDPDIRFTYLIGKRPDGMYFFYVDSEPPSSPDYSPPGQDYPEAPMMIITAFSTGQEITGGPDSDRWGTWVSGAIPVTDPQTGKTIALFGMDIDARNWNRQLAMAALPVITGVLILLILVGAFFILHERDEKERRRIIESDKAIRESEERYRLLFTHSPIGIVQVNRDGVIEMVNDKFAEIIGTPPGQLRGFNALTEIRDPKFLAAGRAALEGKAGMFEGSYTSVITGRSLMLRMVTQPLGSPGTGYSGVIAIVEDVTERKKAEEALEESKANVEAILESTDDIIASYDREIRLIAYNKACADVYRSLFGVEIYPGFRTVDLFPDSQKGFWNENNARALAGESFSTEFSVPTPDGPVRIFESFFRPIRKGSEVAGFSTFTRDITRRKQAEFALAEVTRKLSLLNYVTFNDIENSVFVIDGFVSLLRSGSEEPAGEYLDYIKDSLRKVQKSLSFAKDYQHLGENVPQWQNVNQSFVFGISHLDFSSLERDSRVDTLEIFASPLLERVFFALGKNVITHAHGATKVTLDYTESENQLLLRFRDNGPGIPVEKKEEIFERGYGRQKGMELFLVREILGITGITIHEAGVYGEGACFELVIPRGAYRFADPE